ncbi:MAG: erythromycin esterase family protein [Flavobacteriaceae bacterium]|jgi:erythromycin esterase|nr:erythromycin esterase family protein [Flavobacteriaceae bacterium]
MKKILLFCITASIFFSNCKEVSIEQQVASHIIPFERIDNSSLEEIANRIGDKDIVILGECGHGDGKTYEVKAELVQYLMKEKGFNTLAIEGEGFIDLELKNNQYNNLFSNVDLSKWKPHWGDVVQTKGLILDILYNQNLNWKYIGLEGYNRNVIERDFLYKELEKVDISRNNKNQFIETYEKMNRFEEEGITVEEIDFLLNTIEFIVGNVQDETDNRFVKQALLNIKGGIEDYKYTGVLGGYENENRYVNIRDKRMAENVIWYKKNNPNAKIIVWIANFHGAKQIQKVRYKESDPQLYKSFKLFAEYLVDEFNSDVFSIAFISSSGEVKDILSKSELHQIKAPTNTLEYYLHQRDISFGYLDFNEIKLRSPKLNQADFNSILLGYDNKPGIWLDVFDGVFFIKKNEPLKMSEYQIW